MIKVSIEYLGFRTEARRREYRLRTHAGTETQDYTIGIALSAFAERRARFQDGPEICYLRLQSELAAEVVSKQRDFTITDAELSAYRESHTPAARHGGFSSSAARAAAARSRNGAS